MTTIADTQNLHADRLDIPWYAGGGARGISYPETVPAEYVQLLADWASTNDISPAADVRITSGRTLGSRMGLPPAKAPELSSYPFVQRERDGVYTDGWVIQVTTANTTWELALLDGGHITGVREKPQPDPVRQAANYRDRLANEDMPPYLRLQTSAAWERAMETAREHAQIVRDVVIREESARKIPVAMIAENTGLGVPRIYQILAGRR